MSDDAPIDRTIPRLGPGLYARWRAADIGVITDRLERRLILELTAKSTATAFNVQQLMMRLARNLRVLEWFKSWAADILVKDRVVHFWFSHDESEHEREALRVAAENIAGVRRVEEHIVPSL